MVILNGGFWQRAQSRHSITEEFTLASFELLLGRNLKDCYVSKAARRFKFRAI
jgi:hypothetical protein